MDRQFDGGGIVTLPVSNYKMRSVSGPRWWGTVTPGFIKSETMETVRAAGDKKT